MKKAVTNKHARIAQIIAQRISDDTVGSNTPPERRRSNTKPCYTAWNTNYAGNLTRCIMIMTPNRTTGARPSFQSSMGRFFDSQGNQVTNDFDFTAVEDYFDFDDTFPDD